MTRPLVLYIAMSLDGFIATEQHGLDWLPPGDEAEYNAFIAGIDTLLMGRTTYDEIKKFDEWPYPGKSCIVFTHRSHPVDANVVFTEIDPVKVLTDVRARPGSGIWLVGGAKLVAAFQDQGLVDEYRITVIPITLGSGIPLFSPSKHRHKLTFVDATPMTGGLVQLRYRKAD